MQPAHEPFGATMSLDRYRLYDEIGVGGMARVHLGKLVGAAGFARVVAIKRLHPHLLSDPTVRAMLVDEARLSSRIDDAHVVRTLDVLEHDGAVALVLEYVLGETLAGALRGAREPVPIPIAVAIVLDVLRGLHAAHEAKDAEGRPLGIVHRDVSPQNILIGTDGTTRVIDFGVAKARGRLLCTVTGETKGKPAYMAPEQLVGEPVSRATDVYAAALVLWEMLVGAPLFGGEGAEAIALRVMEPVTTRPSELRREVPARLDAVLLGALSPRPPQRPPTALAFAESLAAVVPPAARSEVALWLEDAAGDRLDLARERLVRVERAVDDLPLPVTAGAAQEDGGAPARRAPRTRTGALLGLAVAAVLLGGALVVSKRPSGREGGPPSVEPSASGAPAATESARGPASLDHPELMAAPSATPPVVPHAAPAAREDEKAASVPVPRAAAAPRAPSPERRRLHGKSVPRKASCSPPYVFDDAGRKIYKPECF